MTHPLIEALVAHGSLTDVQGEEIFAGAKKHGKAVAAAIQESATVASAELLVVYSQAFHMPLISMKSIPADPAVLKSLPAELAQKHRCVPVAREGDALTVAISDPSNWRAQEEIAFVTGCSVKFVLISEMEVMEALEKYDDASVQKMLKDLSDEVEDGGAQTEFFIHDLQEKASEPTLINLVNLIISEAIQQGASDIHIEPFELEMKVKYRVDGILQEMPPPPKNLQPAIVSRIKIMAGMDIAKRHIPQDGYIRINLAKAQVDIRVATVPTIFGEGVVMRLLNKNAILISMEELGFGPKAFARFAPLLERTYGIILVCGPTGSGKTTTLYAVLNKIFTPEKKIITIEDPVEYQLTGVNQIPVRPGRGVTFATGLRSVLRLDPDILLVGEIRDVETAEIAIRSALTGHLIFSTLHTNDAASAVTRLMDMGVEPYLIASALQGILGQRLIRKVCKRCRDPFTPSDAELAQFEKKRADAEGGTFYHAAGCEHCKGRGYSGRMGIFELLLMSEELRQMVINREGSHTIKAAAMKSMTTMREDGWEKIKAGETTFEEVLRQTQREQAADDVAALDE